MATVRVLAKRVGSHGYFLYQIDPGTLRYTETVRRRIVSDNLLWHRLETLVLPKMDPGKFAFINPY